MQSVLRVSDRSGRLRQLSVAQVVEESAQRIREGDTAGALPLLKKAAAFAPHAAPVRYLLGVAQLQQGELDDAIANLQRAVRAEGQNAEYHARLGEALLAREAADAVAHLMKAIELDPRSADAYCSLSAAFGQLRQYGDALGVCDRALQVCGADDRILGNRGAALYWLSRYDEALQCFQQQAGMLATDRQPLVSLGRVFRALGRLQEAKDCHGRACRLNPDDAEAHYGLAMAHLLAGEFRDGFREHEWRWGTAGQKNRRPAFNQPQWDGGELPGGRLLLFAEQGAGDTIQFARYLPLVQRRAPDLMVTAAPALIRLLQWMPGSIEVIPADRESPSFDLQCPLLSLPYVMGTEQSTIPDPASFAIPAEVSRKWQARLDGEPGLKVGVVWAGDPGHANDRNRSVPLKMMTGLFGVPGVRWFSLQVGAAAGERRAAGLPDAIEDLSTELTDYAETAAAISRMDLVITVDTAVAHLAGTLGMPVWVMIPFAPDWRWQLEREDSPWYPSMRLFRQKRAGDWEGVVREIVGELEQLAGGSKPPAPRISSKTDLARWSDPANLEAAWNDRARQAASFIPAGATVLDLGCGAMALEGFLPLGSSYLPCDVVQRDSRTLLCDFNEQPIEKPAAATHVTCLGVLEYMHEPQAFLRQLRSFQIPIVLSYCPTDFTAHLDRRALGWVNHFSLRELCAELNTQGFHIQSSMRPDTNQVLLRAVPAETRLRKRHRVLVLSYNNCGNFGDRLGFHLINSVLPAEAEVQYANFKPWSIPPGDFDLLVLGIGNSLFRPILTEELIGLVRKIPRSVGIFGTQYREDVDAARMSALVDELSIWFARYEEDLLVYGKRKSNALHLGDWLISAFPMAQWKRDETLRVGAEIWNDLPLDRTIQRIQEYRSVESERLHPFLCALTSADQVAYTEQREDGSGQTSGKFRSLLMDVFGRTWPESTMCGFDRDAVAGYRARVLRVMSGMPGLFSGLLGLEPDLKP